MMNFPKIVSAAHAAWSTPWAPAVCKNYDLGDIKIPLKALECEFNRVANTVFGIVGAIFIIWAIMAGIRLMLAGGDPKATGDARKSLTFAVLGFVIVVGAYAIVTIVQNAIGGLNLPLFIIPPPSP